MISEITNKTANDMLVPPPIIEKSFDFFSEITAKIKNTTDNIIKMPLT